MEHEEILQKLYQLLMKNFDVDDIAELYNAISDDDIRQAIYKAWLFKVDAE